MKIYTLVHDLSNSINSNRCGVVYIPKEAAIEYNDLKISFSEVGEFTHLKLVISYNKGGVNYWTYKNEKRGYYVSVTPVTRGENFESAYLFSGYKFLTAETSRYSEKQLKLAAANIDNWKLFEVITFLYTELKKWKLWNLTKS